MKGPNFANPLIGPSVKNLQLIKGPKFANPFIIKTYKTNKIKIKRKHSVGTLQMTRALTSRTSLLKNREESFS